MRAGGIERMNVKTGLEVVLAVSFKLSMPHGHRIERRTFYIKVVDCV